jgi:hypothetical protein
MLQRNEKHACVTQSTPFLYANSLIFNLHYVMVQKSDGMALNGRYKKSPWAIA